KTGEVLPMTVIRQPSLFSAQKLHDIQPIEKYNAIIATINIDLIYHKVMKKFRRGTPEVLTTGHDCFFVHSLRRAHPHDNRFSQKASECYCFQTELRFYRFC